MRSPICATNGASSAAGTSSATAATPIAPVPPSRYAYTKIAIHCADSVGRKIANANKTRRSDLSCTTAATFLPISPTPHGTGGCSHQAA